MKTKIMTLILMTGLTAVAWAQTGSSTGSVPPPTAPATTAPGISNQDRAIPSPNDQRVNQMTPEMANDGNGSIRGQTNGMNPNGNLNSWPNGNNNSTNGNRRRGWNGSLTTNKYNAHANYTNPNSVYINPNSTNVNAYANYTNPNSIYINPNSTDANPDANHTNHYAVGDRTISSGNTNAGGGYYGNNGVTHFNPMNGMTNESNVSTNRHY